MDTPDLISEKSRNLRFNTIKNGSLIWNANATGVFLYPADANSVNEIWEQYKNVNTTYQRDVSTFNNDMIKIVSENAIVGWTKSGSTYSVDDGIPAQSQYRGAMTGADGWYQPQHITYGALAMLDYFRKHYWSFNR